MNVEISPAQEVLDLVQPWFQLSILKDRISVRGGGHGRRKSTAVEAKYNVLCTCTQQPSKPGFYRDPGSDPMNPAHERKTWPIAYLRKQRSNLPPSVWGS